MCFSLYVNRILFRVIFSALLVAISASKEILSARINFNAPTLLEIPDSSPDPVAKALFPLIFVKLPINKFICSSFVRSKHNNQTADIFNCHT